MAYSSRNAPNTGWTLPSILRDNPPMSRYTFPAFSRSSIPRYIVLWDIHWHMIEHWRLQAAADLSAVMTATLERLGGDGWTPEATPEYGFTFVRRGADRRLLMLTSRDPHSTGSQSFNPFR